MHLRTGISSRADWQRLGSKPLVTEFGSNMKCSFASRVLSAACPSWHAKDYIINNDGNVTIHMGFDSDANVHYVGDKRLLINYRSHRGLTVDGLGGNSHVRGIGDLPISITCADGSIQKLVLPDVFYIENNTACILSSFLFLDQCRDLVDSVTITRKKSFVSCNDGSIFNLVRSDDLLVLPVTVRLKTSRGNRKRFKRGDLRGADGSPVSQVSFESSRGSSIDCNYAHLLLCHAGKDKLRFLRKHGLVKGISWPDEDGLHTCYPCAIGKAKLNRFERSSSTYSKRGELVVTDIEGPIGVSSFNGGYEYAVHFTDMYSRFSKVYFMKKKSDVGAVFQRYIDEECTPRDITIECVQSDNASEYCGSKTKFQSICKARSIRFRTSSPYCHWENGIAERVILSMMEKSFSVMAQRALAPEYWAMCLEHVYEVSNFLPHSAFDNRESPYFRWTGDVPDMSRYRPFGCDVRVAIPRDHPDYKKYVNDPAYIGIYVGELSGSGAHLVYRPGSRGEPGSVKEVGERLCKFFDSYDEKLYLLTSENQVYRKYLQYETTPGVVPLLPDKTDFRIAKKFGKDYYFGVASRNNELGDLKYDVRYDDGDFEDMTDFEIDAAKALYIKLSDKDPRSQRGYGADTFSVLPRKITLLELLDHKIVNTSYNNWMAVVRCRYEFTVSGVREERVEWVSLGALLSYVVNFDDSWAMIRTYIMSDYESVSDRHRYHPELFQFLRLERSTRTSNKTASMGLISFEYDPDSETVHAFSADTKKPIFRDRGRFKSFASKSPNRLRSLSLDSADVQVPKNYAEALKLSTNVWVDATEVCIYDFGLADIGDWVPLADVPSGVKPISSRFVYQVKTRLGGKLEAFCRWTPRGFEEQPLEHYDPDSIFAGTPQLWALRMIIVKALTAQWKTIHLDFKRAFSHAPIDRPVYVTLPRGYHLYDENGQELCIRLRKSSEGLKQSAAQWEGVLNEFLLEEGFTQCKKEPHMWRSNTLPSGTRAYVTVYVDDMYITMNDSEWLTGFRQRMDKLAPHKSLGEIEFALGCEVEWTPDRKNVTVTCSRKIAELLRKTGMESCKGANTPLLPGSKLSTDLSTALVTDRVIMNEYRSAVGSLLYIMRAGRPDLDYACWYLACGMTAPTEALVLQLKHVLRYLQYSKNLKLRYGRVHGRPELDLSSIAYSSDEFVGFSDANFEPDRSTTSTLTMFRNAALYWRVKKQSTTSLSSVQSELTALSEQARDVQLLRDVFGFLDMDLPESTTVFCDSRGAIQNAKHPSFSERLRHVQNKIFYIRELVYEKIVSVRWIATKMNPADIGTKALGATQFRLFSFFVMNDSIEAPKKLSADPVVRSAQLRGIPRYRRR